MAGNEVKKGTRTGNGAMDKRPGNADGKQVRRKAVNSRENGANGSNGGRPARLRSDASVQSDGEIKTGAKGRISSTKSAKNGALGAQGKQKQEKENEKEKKRPLWLIPVLVAVVIAIVLFLLHGCDQDLKGLILDMPEYEDSVGYGDLGEDISSEDSIALAVIPDFTVTEESPSFLLPYPENAYDVEFSFIDAESGEERYHSKRVKPGAVIEIPAFSFSDEGEHLYRVEVEVYDSDTYVELPTAVALEMKITKE